MKTIVKFEIALLVLVALVAAGMVMWSEGVFDLLHEPVIAQREAPAIPTDPPAEPPLEKTAPQKEQTKEITRQITAQKYFAYDVRQGEYLLIQGSSDERIYPASITKLLSAYVVLQYMEPTDTVKVGDALNLVQEDSSVAGLEEGDELTVEQLIAAMMLPSGNDAAQVAAVAVGRKFADNNSFPYEDAVKLFVMEMNRQAEWIGMTDSHFVNPDGFHHEDHYTTMNDLVRLCETVLMNETILKYTGSLEVTVEQSGRKLEWVNTNVLLHEETEVYHPNAIGLKTGYTSKAGNCLVSAFFMEDRILLIGVFGCPAFTDDRYLDTVAIYNSI